jgi:hypothetical protein
MATIPPPNPSPPPPTDKKSTGLIPLIAIIGGSAAVFSFWADYGLVAIGVAVAVSALLALYQLHFREPFSAQVMRWPHVLIGLLWIAAAAGVVLAILGGLKAQTLVDWLRPEFEYGPIRADAYKSSAAPWNSLPGEGASSIVKTSYSIAGWKRLMDLALTNDPANSPSVRRQLFFVETKHFDRGYRSFTAEVELPTSLEISEVYAFLSADEMTGDSRPHERLQSLRTDRVGVDVNKCHVIVTSPGAGEHLQVFIVAGARNNQPFPKDVESSIVVRSIR